jgi:hypothetical protein
MPVLLALILGFTGPGITPAGPACPFTPEPYSRAALIRFSNGTELDTRSLAGLPDSVEVEPGGYVIAALSGPVRHDWLARLARLGAQPVCQVGPQAVACRIGRRLRASAVRSAAPVTWIGSFPASAKLSLELAKVRTPADVVVVTWPGESMDAVAEAAVGLGAEVLAGDGAALTCRVDASGLGRLAGLDQVAWIQAVDSFVPFNDNVQWVIQAGWRPEVPDSQVGRPAWVHGILGQGIVVGLFDSGINTNHDMFFDPDHPITGPGLFPDNRRIVAYKLYRNADFGDVNALAYHGSAVAGTLAGNDSLNGDSSRCDGVATDARIYFVDNGTTYGNYVYNSDLTELLDSVRLGLGTGAPVRQVSGSFGSAGSLGAYRLEEATVDATCWHDPKFLVVWSAGNYGIGSGTITHPACAKDIITVGATGNGVQSNILSGSSSTGPTNDGRTKPDLVAPGIDVNTVDGATLHGYAGRNGTSFSAPAVSGALVLLRQYLRDGWFPSGSPVPEHAVPDPSSALMRALAVCACDSNAGTNAVPNNEAGWGRLNLSRILHFPGDSVSLTLVDDSVGLASGVFHEYSFDLLDRRPLSVTLAWTDTAAPPSAAIALVNDLDLELTSPDRNHYRGNQFLGGQSAANPPGWDELNVAEACRIAYPLAGTWTVRVYARSLYTARQPYALVVKGGLVAAPSALTDVVSASPARRATIFGTHMELDVAGARSVTVYSADGRIVLHSPVVNGRTAADRGLAPGVYYYVVELGNGRQATGKAVVVR